MAWFGLVQWLMCVFSAAPNDVDDLVKQLKDTAEAAGLPADQVESWLKSKADDKKIDAVELVSTPNTEPHTSNHTPRSLRPGVLSTS